jgi:hypothetical protein
MCSKKEFKKPDISQNVHLGISSNFANTNFNIWTTSSVSKKREILLRFKMTAGFKMAVKKRFFDHNSVNIKYFYTVIKKQHYLHGSGLLGSEKQWL